MTRRGLACCAVGLVLWQFAAGRAHADDPNSLELAVKAAFVYKFPYYVSWPPSALPATNSPFKLCIVGNDPFGSLIDQAVSGQTVFNRSILVARMATATDSDHCQMLYLATGDQQVIRHELAVFAGQPVLTITDAISDQAAKGMINFIIVDNRVRFEIDDATATRDGLLISSKLLGVALAVKSLS